MNERLRELAKQAGWTIVMGTRQPIDQRDYVVSPEQAEKFAELIVRECLEACSRANDIRHFVPPTQEQVVLSCMREIETTFRS